MVKKFPDLQKEHFYWKDGLSVIGVDEVGRGCLAGPVVAGAVCFDTKHDLIKGITDSKQLTADQRTHFDEKIRSGCQQCAIGLASVTEINTLGIVPATFLAMERALLQFEKVQVVLVDGSLTPVFHELQPQTIETIVKGDQLSYSIAAGSIIAKVFRDQIMQKLATEFPEFGWGQNKGYGTQKHRDALKKLGVTKHHRTLFCRNVLAG